MIGSSARPFSVSAYSTRGGTSGKVWRSTIPSSSSARSRSESVRGLIPASERSSSQKRERPVGQVADEQQRPLAAHDLRRPAHRTCFIDGHFNRYFTN